MLKTDIYKMEDSTTCRVCESEDDLRPLFDGDRNPIALRLMSCANVKVSEADGLPQHICNKCIGLLELCYSFKLQCEKTDKRLRTFAITSKIEEIADEEYFPSQDPIATIIIGCEDDSFLETNGDNSLENHIIQCDDIIPSKTQENVIEKPQLRSHEAPFSKKSSFEDYPITSVIVNECEGGSFFQTHGDNSLENHIILCVDNISSETQEKVIEKSKWSSRRAPCSRKSSFEEYPITSVIVNECEDDSLLQTSEDNSLEKDGIQCNDTILSETEEKVIEKPNLRSRKAPSARKRSTIVQECEDDPFLHTNEDNSLEKDMLQRDDTVSSETEDSVIEKPTLQLSRKEYPCTGCNEVFLSYPDLCKHRAIHGSKRYVCRICNTSFSRKAYLDKHQKTHEDINDIQIHECQICFKKYTSKGNLLRHMRGHNGDLRHVCDVCGKRFIQSTTLRSHQLTHQDVKQFQCKDCDKAFKSKQYLTHHREKMHSESNTMSSFCCDMCGRRFINERNLKWHIRNHIKPNSNNAIKTVKRPKLDHCFVCPYCGKTFKQKAQLLIHQRIHTGEKPYKCEICYKKFRFQASYKFHLNSHTGERPFACNMCDKKFRQPTHLRNHMQVHTGVKPHKCTFCDKSFASKSNLKVHTRIHTGERPYECIVCGVGFLDSNGLKKHSKKHVT